MTHYTVSTRHGRITVCGCPIAYDDVYITLGSICNRVCPPDLCDACDEVCRTIDAWILAPETIPLAGKVA